MIIPERFQLHGQTLTVSYDKELSKRENLLGCASSGNNTVELLPPSEDNPLSKVEQTFLHELTHMILLAMEERELSNNEQFVDVFASLLHQAITSSTGDLDIPGP